MRLRGWPMATAMDHMRDGRGTAEAASCSSIEVASLARVVSITQEVPFISTKMERTPPWRCAIWWSQKAVVRMGIF